MIIKSNYSESYNLDEIRDICNLPNLRNQEVIIKGSFEGIDEYWSLYPIQKKCDPIINIELNIDRLDLSRGQRNIFNETFKSYSKRHILLVVKGVYRDEKKEFGHLGSNQAEFVVSKIYSMELIDSRKSNHR
jgi:hypothetical protein